MGLKEQFSTIFGGNKNEFDANGNKIVAGSDANGESTVKRDSQGNPIASEGPIDADAYLADAKKPTADLTAEQVQARQQVVQDASVNGNLNIDKRSYQESVNANFEQPNNIVEFPTVSEALPASIVEPSQEPTQVQVESSTINPNIEFVNHAQPEQDLTDNAQTATDTSPDLKSVEEELAEGGIQVISGQNSDQVKPVNSENQSDEAA